MPLDFSSLAVTAGREASRAALDQAIREYLGWVGDPIATLTAAAEGDEQFALGHVLTGVLRLLSGEIERASPGLVQNSAASKAAKHRLTPWERAHVAAFDAWRNGQIRRAAAIWEEILIDYPRDVWALRFAHDTYFYLGDAANLRDSPARVLPAWSAADDLQGYLLGMHAFGLEECGDYRAAETTGRQAVEGNPADTWAIHAVAHVLEMEGRQDEGIGWLQGLQAHWQAAPALAVHQWWHLALFLIERGRLEEVLDIYDKHVRGTPSAAFLDLVDAAALLWRLQLAGVGVGDRWHGLDQHWFAHVDEHVLVFNDAHLAMVAGGLNDKATAEKLDQSIERYVGESQGTNRDITRQVGQSVVRAITAFADGDFARVIDLLLPLRYEIWRIGGSHAQRDLFTQTLIAASLADKRWPLARALLAERVALRPASAPSWRQYAQALQALGDKPGAAAALRQAHGARV
jgi:tetratricopeptide (TPR) repeat protein